jgi:hypothetical protein
MERDEYCISYEEFSVNKRSFQIIDFKFFSALPVSTGEYSDEYNLSAPTHQQLKLN